MSNAKFALYWRGLAMSSPQSLMYFVLALLLALVGLKALPNARKASLVDSIWRQLDSIANRVPMRFQRGAAVLIFVPYLFLGLARMFESTVYGIAPRGPHALVTLVGIVFTLVFGPGLWRDAVERHEEQKRREIEFEKSQVRDPVAEAQFRKQIGMTPDESSERDRNR